MLQMRLSLKNAVITRPGLCAQAVERSLDGLLNKRKANE